MGILVCGVLVVLVMNIVICGSDEDVVYVIVCVMVFGLVVMFVLLWLGYVLGFGVMDYGIWVGVIVYEVV